MQNQRIKILIVEDDPDMAELIADLVEAEGWSPTVVHSAEDATAILGRDQFHIVLLDHNLPGISGRTFAQRVRTNLGLNVGILMVTAAGSATERVLGLETAADDYVVKPFEPIELTARIKAVLRRIAPSLKVEKEPEREHEASSLRLGDWAVDLSARRALCLADRSKTLTSAEFALLEILAQTPNKPVSRSQILDRLGAESDRFIDRNVDVLVLRLRRKIERNPDLPQHIQTRRGKGYVLHTEAAEPTIVIERRLLQSIAFRLPFAIVFICSSVFILSSVAIYGLHKAKTEMAAYSLQAFSSLARASLVSRQVADLVSSAPLLMNATSPYRVSSESRAVVAQVDGLLQTIAQYKHGDNQNALPNDDIVSLLQSIRQQTMSLAADADAAQQHKAEAAAALGQIATRQTVNEDALRQRLNALVQAAANSASLFQLGELQRRFTAETGYFLNDPAAAPQVGKEGLALYKSVFDAQTQYLLEMFAIQSSVSKLHTVSRTLSHATETQSGAVAERLTNGLDSASAALTRLIVMVAIAFFIVVILSTVSIRSVMRVSSGITALSTGMNSLAKGEKDVTLPAYRGSETELVRLSDAFHAFKDSVDRVSRLRRTAEAAARTIRSTFRTMNEGIALFDATGHPITMNRRVIELVGRRGGSSRKLSLRKFIDTIPEIDPELLPRDGAPGTLANRITVRHRTDDQQVTEIAISRQPDGGIVILARDVTAFDRQEAEAAKAQRLDGIMRMTHQLSHEVGNMIGIITGSLGLLERETGFSERQQRNINRIRKAANRGRELASSMLSIGSQQPIHPASVDIGALLRAMMDVLEIAVGPNNEIALEIEDGLPRLALDAALFEQSILNLCLNAAAALPTGGSIIISARLLEQEVEVSVEDNGRGMDQDAIDRAFEPYFTTRAQQGGTGLGLAMVYGFMRQSGGDAKITSRPEQGVRVALTFPTRGDEQGGNSTF